MKDQDLRALVDTSNRVIKFMEELSTELRSDDSNCDLGDMEYTAICDREVNATNRWLVLRYEASGPAGDYGGRLSFFRSNSPDYCVVDATLVGRLSWTSEKIQVSDAPDLLEFSPTAVELHCRSIYRGIKL